jgi:replicative superfamily II helicase
MNVDVVVLDEVHYLSDISRGTVWEETVLSNTLLVLYLKLCRCCSLSRRLCHSYSVVVRLSRSSSASKREFRFASHVSIPVEQVIYCPKEVQLICLSATVSNPEELAGWIAQVRPMLLYHIISYLIV